VGGPEGAVDGLELARGQARQQVLAPALRGSLLCRWRGRRLHRRLRRRRFSHAGEGECPTEVWKGLRLLLTTVEFFFYAVLLLIALNLFIDGIILLTLTSFLIRKIPNYS
jgi:hypothetical protein